MNLGKRAAAITIAVCAIGGGIVAHVADGIGRVDGFLYDAALAARAALMPAPAENAPSPVVVIAVDERSLTDPRLARYPRAMLGKIWEPLLLALVEADAKAIAFDLLLAYSGNALDRGFDRSFMIALSRNGDRIVLGRSAATVPARQYLAALRNDPGALGLLEIIPDDDGIYRRVQATPITVAGEPLPGLTAAALERGGGPAMPAEVLLAPRRHLETLPTYSLIDVLTCADGEPARLAEIFAGRLVFIGTTLPDEDRKRNAGRFLPEPPPAATVEDGMPGACDLTPKGASVSAAGVQETASTVPGVFLHASAAEAVMRDDLTRNLPVTWRVVAGVLFGGIGALIGLTLSPWMAAGATLLGGVAAWAGEVVLLEAAYWYPAGPAIGVLLAAVILAYSIRYLAVERRQRLVTKAFDHYLAPDLVARLAENPGALRLGGDVRHVTVMFADLSGFTALSTKVSPKDLMQITNRYLALIADSIDVTGGYVDKFIGDAVMGIWGAPANDPDHAVHAVDAALRITRLIHEARAEVADGAHSFGVKIGAHTGDAIVGNVGSQKRFNYTAVGETVNVASRLEGLPGVYGCEIVISDTTAAVIGDGFLLRELDRVAVKGRAAPVGIYEVMAAAVSADDSQRRLAADYGAALDLYRSRRFDEAAAAFTAIADDGPSRVMAARCRDYGESPPPADWNGILVLTRK